MHILSKLRDEYFPNDKNLQRNLINSNIIPQDFDIDETANQIFNDYIMIYEKYQEVFLNHYTSEHEIILKNKDIIINEIKRRYTEMLSICSACKTSEQNQ